ncbi:GAF and ANTAR domain-containing protein [Kribbella sp. NPDC000426]|uniref:GAF and ANTAR domain-containing protein n=1 Tax=Kribbella sp. NPDC000426 TaxID=3154255 RepID=UPI0033324BE8
MNRSDHPSWAAVPDLAARFVADPDLNRTLSWLMQRCAELPGVRASALLLAGEEGVLEVAAASSGLARQLHQLESRIAEGPSQDSYANSRRIDCADLTEAGPRWPRYAAAALRVEIRAVEAFPLRLPAGPIGALTLCFRQVGERPEDELERAQALADVTALGVAGSRANQDKARADQLQGALDSRVLIEQAKGLLAERLGVSPDEAFTTLRSHARNNHLRLAEVCTSVLDGTLTVH